MNAVERINYEFALSYARHAAENLGRAVDELTRSLNNTSDAILLDATADATMLRNETEWLVVCLEGMLKDKEAAK